VALATIMYDYDSVHCALKQHI